MDDSLHNPQWTIRKIPWMLILIPMAGVSIAFWLLFFQKSSLAVAGSSLLFTLIILFFIEITTCTFDSVSKKIQITRQRIWRKKTDIVLFRDINSIAVQVTSGTDDNQPTYRIVFVTHDGKIVPFTTQYDGGRKSKENLAKKIHQYLKVHHTQPINLALDGSIRIQLPYAAEHDNWLIQYVYKNDAVPLTSFQKTSASSFSGYMLFIPAGITSTTRMSGGLGGTIIRKLYEAYFRTMDISFQEITNFENSIVLNGQEIGLSKRVAVLTNQPHYVRTWLQGSKAQQLIRWQNENPLRGKTAAVEPHILVNQQTIKIVFRDYYTDPAKIRTIIAFGNQLL